MYFFLNLLIKMNRFRYYIKPHLTSNTIIAHRETPMWENYGMAAGNKMAVRNDTESIVSKYVIGRRLTYNLRRQIAHMIAPYVFRVYMETAEWQPSKPRLGINLSPTPTMDYRPSRYNFIINKHGIVTKVLLF